MRWVTLAAALAAALAATPATAGVLDRARETGELRVGYRPDAQPFSFKDAQGVARGYSVDLCRAVATEAAAAVTRPDLRVVEVEVSAQDRLDALTEGRVDLLCEATSVTLERRERMDFSLPTFATGATLLYPAGGATNFQELAGKKVGVLAGSTIEEGLREALAQAGIGAEVVPVPSHTEAMDRLVKGELAAYFGDGAILLYNLMQSPAKDQLRLADAVLSFEPYALALPKDDGAFRLVVDRALARLSRSKDIVALFERNFGAGAEPSELVEAIWVLNQLPE